MGHFSFSCQLTGLPITSGKPAVLIVMKLRDMLYDNSEDKLRKYGRMCLVSNEGTQVKFQPVWFPIYGNYDEYGGLEDIIHDDNTKVLEDFYGLSIEQLVEIVTSGRKADGFDDALKVIKDPTKKDEYQKPKYLDRYKELLTYSAMWVDGKVYHELTSEPTKNGYDYYEIGHPEILEALGFHEIDEDENYERYTRQFMKDDLIVHTDGTWINVKNEFLHSLHDFKKYCQKMGVNIDIEEIEKKDRIEQIYDYVLPKRTETELLVSSNRDIPYFKYLLFNEHTTIPYFAAAKEGKIRDNLVRFWRFDYYMFSMGRYYNIIGTSPQDGDYKAVKKVLKTALKHCKR